ncbi:MAG TPA: response regulator, partial [Polyangiaceae bacterium]|nr:response regulator [Polyangiaceae bacterium]
SAAALARRAIARGREALGDPVGDAMLYAFPVAASGTAAPLAVVVRADARRLLAPELACWPGLGESSGAYLVRRDGANVVLLTPHPLDPRLGAGTRVPLQSRAQLAATMAALGVESHVESEVRRRPTWAVTRKLSLPGWGLVSLADRDDVLAGLRDTEQGLWLLDIALAIGLFAIAVVWRRITTNALTRQAMELTERHAKRVQSVFDNAFDAILTFDRSGRVRTVNRAAATLFRRTPAELERHPVSQVLQWGGAGSAALPEPGTIGSGEVMTPDGTQIPVEYSLGATGGSDELLYTAIVRDVSERIEAERRIRTFAEGLEASNRRLEEVNAQLEEASRLKTEFLANTSHELRTPLNGMIGFLQLVLDGMCDSPEEERDFLKQALQCSRHLLALINDVLDIAKIEAGKFALELEALDVDQLFDEVQTLTHVQAAQRGLQLSFEAKLEPGVTARGDFAKVKQVLVNLIGNSLKFTHEGIIHVRAESRATLGHVMFEVEDTGIGIPPSRQNVIFDKFVQADGSTTRRYGGTGLGLAISRSLIEMMGGVIGVHSDGEGRGTRMYFSLPLWRPASAAAEASARSSGAGGALVLIVEDDPTFRLFLGAVLHEHGYRVIEATDADHGWEAVLRERPDCVLLDYALTSGDAAQLRTGWDLARRMTGEPDTRHVPIVFVTGFGDELQAKLRSTAFARRPDRLVKPIDADVLVRRIEAILAPLPERPVRVLLADDDAGVATYVRKVLPAERFQLHLARDGAECLHALRTGPAFDLLLLDLMMPGVSGYDVLRDMALSGLHAELPVLVLTNFTESRNDEERRLLEQGLVLDVLAKSAVHDDPALLPRTLERHAARGSERGREPGGDAMQEAA